MCLKNEEKKESTKSIKAIYNCLIRLAYTKEAIYNSTAYGSCTSRPVRGKKEYDALEPR